MSLPKWILTSGRIVRMIPLGLLLQVYPGGAGFNSYRLVGTKPSDMSSKN